jgi:hypothetical protein
LIFRFAGAPEILARAESMPSAEVPDIMPRTSMGFEVMKRVKVIFNTEDTENTEERRRKECKE